MATHYYEAINIDHDLLGVHEGGTLGGDDGMVFDLDIGPVSELTNHDMFFRWSDPISIPQHSESLPAFTSHTFGWEDAVVARPISHSHTASFYDSDIHKSYDFAGWNITPAQYGSAGACTEHTSSFRSDGGDLPFTADLLHMHRGDMSPGFLHPIHAHSFPTGWTDQLSPAMSRTESVASLETAMEQSTDMIDGQVEPIGEYLSEAIPWSIPLLNQNTPPTSAQLGRIVLMQMDLTTNQMRANNDSRKNAKGRKGPLRPDIKKNAAAMRNVGACESCKKRKTKCDNNGGPCRACIHYYKCDLVHSPCRGRQLQQLANVLLTGTVFPSGRTLGKYIDKFVINPAESEIKISLGFGPPIRRMVKVVFPQNYPYNTFSQEFQHDHVVYPWPEKPGSGTHREMRHHYVFPAVLSKTTDLLFVVNKHLGTLLDDPANFRQFPLFCSPLKVLCMIYKHYADMTESNEKQLLRQALKLLILVHIGGDMTITPTQGSRDIINHFFGNMIDDSEITPCFIRGQLGPVFSELALILMKDVLKELEFHCLSRECQHFPLVISTFAVLFMAVESIQYHAAKDAYHSTFDSPFSSPRPISVYPASSEGPEGIDALFNFYKACFSGCHSDSLLSVSRDLATSAAVPINGVNGGVRFVAGLKDAVERVRTYVVERSTVSVPEKTKDEDITLFFDRLLARLFLLQG